MSSQVAQPSTASTTSAAGQSWKSRLFSRTFTLHCLTILVLVHMVEVCTFGAILQSTDAIPHLVIYLGVLVMLSLLFLLLGMFAGDPLAYRSLYHVVHFAAIACGYLGIFQVTFDDSNKPVSIISYVPWPMSTLLGAWFLVLVDVMNGIYNVATGATGGIIRPLSSLFQTHAALDAEETSEMTSGDTGTNSIMRSLSTFSHHVHRPTGLDEETRALLCPSPVEGKSEKDFV